MKYLLLIILTFSCTRIKVPEVDSTKKWTYEGLNRKSENLGKYTFTFKCKEKTMNIYLLLWHQRNLSYTQEIYLLSSKNERTKIEPQSEEEKLLIRIIDENLISTKSIYQGEELNWLKHKVSNRYDGLKNYEVNILGALKSLKKESIESLQEKSDIKEN